jgi:hypothetical protein
VIARIRFTLAGDVEPHRVLAVERLEQAHVQAPVGIVAVHPDLCSMMPFSFSTPAAVK